NEINQRLALALLEERGHSVVVAHNGHEAVRCWEQEPFDCILMDVQMPEMDGLQATATIRAQERVTQRHVPIIAMTAHALPEDRERCLAAGMDDYLAKPIRFEQLLEVVEACGTAAARPGPAAGESEPPVASATAPAAVVFELQTALARVGGKPALFKQLVAVFAKHAPTFLAAVQAAIAQHDGAALQRAAHRLKGWVGTFAASAAMVAAQRLEDLGRQGDVTQVEAAYGHLAREIARLEHALGTAMQGFNEG